VQTFKNSGKLNLALQKGRYGNLQSLQANVDGSYSPDGFDVPIMSFATGNMDFQAIARAKGDTLEIDKIQLDQGQAKFASGYVSMPFVWRNLGTKAAVIPTSGKVSATFQTQDLDLKRLFDDLGIKAMTSGIMNARLDANGTVADLSARLDMQVRDLRNEYWPKMEPATFESNSAGGNNWKHASRHSKNCACPEIAGRHTDHCKSSRSSHVRKFCSSICSRACATGWRAWNGC